MKTIAKTVCAVSLASVLAVALTGCSGSKTAATVGKASISEDTITSYIESFRSSQGLDDDGTFAFYLTMYGMTPETLREEVVNLYVNKELVLLAAQEKGMSVDSSEIDEYESKIRANYASDDAWETALKNAGLTEEEYRDNIEYALLYQQLTNSFGVSDEPTEDEVLAVAQENIHYMNGAKRSSHILFSTSDQETAQNVLDQINDGTLDFAEAAKEYSIDSSAEDGGDVGWDILTSFVTEYQEGLDALEKGQVSGLVESDYGYHIIKCTDVLEAPDPLTSLSELPDEFQTFFTSLATSSTSSTAFSSWLNAYKKTVDIKVNSMPSGLSYDIDMESALASFYSSMSSTSDSSSTDESTTEEETSDSSESEASSEASE